MKEAWLVAVAMAVRAESGLRVPRAVEAVMVAPEVWARSSIVVVMAVLLVTAVTVVMVIRAATVVRALTGVSGTSTRLVGLVARADEEAPVGTAERAVLPAMLEQVAMLVCSERPGTPEPAPLTVRLELRGRPVRPAPTAQSGPPTKLN